MSRNNWILSCNMKRLKNLVKLGAKESEGGIRGLDLGEREWMGWVGEL